jgi:hypothetical protein
VDCAAIAGKYNPTTTRTGVDGVTKVIFSYITNQVGADASMRRFGNSVNIPLSPTERDRVIASICTKPEMAGMVGHAFANKVELDGKLLSTVNPALLEQFTNMMPKEWADKVLSGAIAYDDALKVASQLAGIFTVYDTDNKVHDGQTSWNYTAQAGYVSTEGNVRPIFVNSYEYAGKFLVYEITEKGREGCWSRFGINVEDQRIVGLPCTKPKPTPTPTPTNPTTAPPTTAPPTTAPPTTAPPTTAPPTTAPPTTTTPSPTKTPSEHPANNGNATPPATPAPTVTEPASSPSHAPSATYTPAPAPTPTKQRTTAPAEPPPPRETATASIDPCKGADAKNNPAC